MAEQISILVVEDPIAQTSTIPPTDATDIGPHAIAFPDESIDSPTEVTHSPNPKIIPASLISNEEVQIFQYLLSFKLL